MFTVMLVGNVITQLYDIIKVFVKKARVERILKNCLIVARGLSIRNKIS